MITYSNTSHNNINYSNSLNLEHRNSSVPTNQISFAHEKSQVCPINIQIKPLACWNNLQYTCNNIVTRITGVF